MKACFSAGADAVYMGLPRFSARAFAENAAEDLYLEAIDYAHLHGKKLYCTVNTLMKEEELRDQLFDVLDPLYRQGLDAVIMQDIGAMRFVRQHFPDLSIFASTQCTITSSGSVEAYRELGVSRFILARELSLNEIRKIKEETGAELECFIHGALCYCYSGQCLFSSLAGSRSGNRGRCAQPCRMEYNVRDEKGQLLLKDARILSLKDLNTLKILPEIIEAGATSLKIEGRMKKAEYAAGVTSIYRKYLDLYETFGKTAYQVDPADEKALFDLFNRQGFTEGYFKEKNASSMITMKENAFREENTALNERIRKAYIDTEKQVPVRGRYEFRLGRSLKLHVETELDGRTFFADAESENSAEAARGREAVKEDVEKQLLKTGNTAFYFEDLKGELESGLFLQVKVLNELRRRALEQLSEKILTSYRRENDLTPEKEAVYSQKNSDPEVSGKGPMLLSAEVRTEGQFQMALEEKEIDRIILASVFCFPSQYKTYTESCQAAGKQCFLAFPRIFREEAAVFFETCLNELKEAGFDGFVLPSFDALSFIMKYDIPGIRISDHSLYAFNSMAASEIKKTGVDAVTVPLELNYHEMLRVGLSGESLILYGYLPMMVSAGCIHKNSEGCDRKGRKLILEDRKKNRMTVLNDCLFCQNTILNAYPLSLLDEREHIGLLSPKEGRLLFTKETDEETRSVLKAFIRVFKEGKDVKENIPDFTRGHFRRGTA